MSGARATRQTDVNHQLARAESTEARVRPTVNAVILRVHDDNDVRDNLVTALTLGIVDAVKVETRLLTAVRAVVAPSEWGATVRSCLATRGTKVPINNFTDTKSCQCGDVLAAAIAHDGAH